MRNFYLRTLSGFIYVLLVLGSIVAGPLYFGGLMSVFLLLSLAELFGIGRKEKYGNNAFLFFIPSVIVYFFLFYSALNNTLYVMAGLVVIFHLALIYQLYKPKRNFIMNKSGFVLLPVIYLAIPLGLLNYFFSLASEKSLDTRELVAGYFIIIWLYDTFAYITGRLLGKNKLFESVSPKKTWEGSIGGFILAMAGAYLIGHFSTVLSSPQWLGMAAITIIFGTFGDLFESFIKRNAGVKDSGHLIPGHGGILDRVDSILVSAPFVFLYLYIIY